MKPIPDWLAPHKGEWVSQGFLLKNIRSSPQAFSTWFLSVRERVRQVSVPQANRPCSRQYLVKSVWAMAQAHGLDLQPAITETPAEARLAEAQQTVIALERRLAETERRIAVAARTSGNRMKADLELLHRLATSTDPGPAEGVYLLIGKFDEVVYVGQSRNVLSRMAGHADKDFMRVRMIPTMGEADRMALEKSLIGLLTPRLNTQFMPISEAARLRQIPA